jgi:hypothetical protein
VYFRLIVISYQGLNYLLVFSFERTNMFFYMWIDPAPPFSCQNIYDCAVFVLKILKLGTPKISSKLGSHLHKPSLDDIFMMVYDGLWWSIVNPSAPWCFSPWVAGLAIQWFQSGRAAPGSTAEAAQADFFWWAIDGVVELKYIYIHTYEYSEIRFLWHWV